MNEKRGLISRGRFDKSAQVWVETVIYTLIGLVIMGAIIAIVTPKINELNDKMTISQTTTVLNELNSQILDTLLAPGNKREVLLTVKKGEYTIDAPNNQIVYVLPGSTYLASEINESIPQGDIIMRTVDKTGEKYDIYLSLNYRSFNLTYQNKDANKTLTKAPVAYKLLIEYVGGSDKKINIDSA